MIAETPPPFQLPEGCQPVTGSDTLLHSLLACGDPKPRAGDVRQYADKPELIHARDRGGKAPFLVAVKEDAAVPVIRALLEIGSDPNAADKDGETPVHVAANDGKQQITKLLVQAGGDVNRPAKDGDRPLHKAVYNEKPAAVAVLAELGADIDAKDSDSRRDRERWRHVRGVG